MRPLSRRLLFGLLFVSVTVSARGQHLDGTLTLSGETGYLTNAYLDPFIPVWERSMRAPFAALSPGVRLSWSGARSFAAVEASGRLTTFSEDGASWLLGRGQVLAQRSLTERLAAGVSASGSRLRLVDDQWLAWGAAYLQWRVARRARLSLWGGGSYRRLEAPGAAPARWTSSFGLFQAELWPGTRWHVKGSAYASRTPGLDLAGGGTSVEVGYQPVRPLWVSLEAGLDRFGAYGPAAASGMDRSWRAAARADWSVAPEWTVTARLGLQQYGAAPDDASLGDVYLSAGFTYRLTSRRSLRPEPRPLWTAGEDGVRLRIPYEGDGEVYLLGDFNGWADQGVSLVRATDEVYGTTLSLEPGTYQYKIFAVEDGSRRWLPFPEHALTVDDGFGGRNGLLIVD